MNSFMITRSMQISDEEKIKRFNAMYQYVKDGFDLKVQGRLVRDFEHYCFEILLENTLAVNRKNPQAFWDYYNSLKGD